MPKGLQRKGVVRKNKLLHAAIKLFVQNGYEKTSTAAIAKEAGMSPSSFFAAFESKEELLLALEKVMFASQFDNARKLGAAMASGPSGASLGASSGTSSGKSSSAPSGSASTAGPAPDDPVLLYAAETSLQLCITELSEPLRELYVMTYSLPTTSEYVYQSTAGKLQQIFSPYLPGAQLKDFYEMDIASAGIMRAFMAKPCDMYFTMESKLSRFLGSSLTLYRVPEDKQAQVAAAVRQMGLKAVAQQIVAGMVERAEAGLDIVGEEGAEEQTGQQGGGER